MGIYHCNQCKHTAEHSAENVTIACANCNTPAKVYNATVFTQHLIDLLRKATLENNQLKERLAEFQKDDEDVEPVQQASSVDNISLTQTNTLATAEQHYPVKFMLEQKGVKPTFDYQTVNTQGYYDEASENIGQNFNLFKDVLSKISWAYAKKHNGINFDLTKYSQAEAQKINAICRSFYNYTLFSRYVYQKQSKTINLALQSAMPIRKFFLGEWLEWYVLNRILALIEQAKQRPNFSCARSVNIQFQNNQDKHELDIVFVNQRKELFIIECKSGEYRQDLNKYLTLRKRLNLPADKFSILVTDVNEVQAQSMTAMYELNFITLEKLEDYLKAMIF